MKRIIVSVALMAACFVAGAQNYATPETLDNPGPYKAHMDFSLVSAAQGPGVAFLGGDPGIMRQVGTMDYVIDFTKAKVGRTNFLEEYKKADNNAAAVEELEDLNKTCRLYFHTNFNQRNKGTKVNKENVGTERIMEVHVLKVNTGSGWGSVLISDSISDGESSVGGYITVVEAATGEILAVYSFNDISSGSSLPKKLRIATPFAQLGIKFRKVALK